MNVVEYLTKEMQDLVDEDAEWDVVAGGFQFTEGPVWVPEEQALYFSDIPTDTIYRWHEPTEHVSVFKRSSRKANGMTRDPEGFLLACEQITRRVVRLSRDAESSVLVDKFSGKKFNSPNDIIVDRSGATWFTDPVYGITSVFGGYPGTQEQRVKGVYRRSSTGEVELMITDMDAPNGLALSPDGTVLYVTDSERYHVRSFKLEQEKIVDLGIFAVLDQDSGQGPPDGLRVASTGHLFVTGPGGIWIFNQDGENIGIIKNVEVVANCEFALSDQPYLYVTASTSVCRLPLRRDLR